MYKIHKNLFGGLAPFGPAGQHYPRPSSSIYGRDF